MIIGKGGKTTRLSKANDEPQHQPRHSAPTIQVDQLEVSSSSPSPSSSPGGASRKEEGSPRRPVSMLSLSTTSVPQKAGANHADAAERELPLIAANLADSLST